MQIASGNSSRGSEIHPLRSTGRRLIAPLPNGVAVASGSQEERSVKLSKSLCRGTNLRSALNHAPCNFRGGLRSKTTAIRHVMASRPMPLACLQGRSKPCPTFTPVDMAQIGNVLWSVKGVSNNIWQRRQWILDSHQGGVFQPVDSDGVPYGIRTRVTNVKGWCPRPLDEGDCGAVG